MYALPTAVYSGLPNSVFNSRSCNWKDPHGLDVFQDVDEHQDNRVHKKPEDMTHPDTSMTSCSHEIPFVSDSRAQDFSSVSLTQQCESRSTTQDSRSRHIDLRKKDISQPHIHKAQETCDLLHAALIVPAPENKFPPQFFFPHEPSTTDIKMPFTMATAINHQHSSTNSFDSGICNTSSSPPHHHARSRSRAIAIKSQCTTDPFHDENELVLQAERMYDNATWQMYNRIISYRQKHSVAGGHRRAHSKNSVHPNDDFHGTHEKHSRSVYYDMEDEIFDMEI